MKDTVEVAFAMQSYDEGLKNLETAILDDMFDGKLEHGNLYVKQTRSNNPKINLYDISSPILLRKEYATAEQVNLRLSPEGRYVMELPIQYGVRLLKDGKLEIFDCSAQESKYVMDW